MTRLVLLIGIALVGAATRAAEPSAVQTGTPRRVIAADDSKRTLAAIGTDGRVE